MTDSDQEAQWRNEFEVLGYDEVRTHAYNGDYPQGHLKRQVALRWLREKEIAREARDIARDARDEAAYSYSKWTFVAAVAAVIVSIIGVLVTWYLH